MVDLAPERLVIEPVGPAGSGKTTLLRTLIKHRGDIVAGVRPKPAKKFLSILRVVGLLGPLLPKAMRDREWFTRDQIRSMVYLDCWCRELRNSTKAGTIVLLDHGPIFRLARLDEFGPPAARTVRFRRWWETRLAEWGEVLDLVVRLDAPEDLLIERIRSRKTHHLVKEQTDESGRALLLRYRRAYDKVLTGLAGRGRTKVLQFDTSTVPSDRIAMAVLGTVSKGNSKTNGQS